MSTAWCTIWGWCVAQLQRLYMWTVPGAWQASLPRVEPELRTDSGTRRLLHEGWFWVLGGWGQ